MAANQDLEDFASGIGPGAYSPQQGSALPPAAQGGVPLGGSSPTQPSPIPTPSFQRAPLTSLGGQAPQVDVGAILNQRLQAIQSFNPATSSWAQKGDYYRMLHELPALSQVAGMKSQDRQLQAGYLKQVSDTLKEYTALLPEQQATQRPLIEKLLAAQAELSGIKTDPASIQHVLKSPDITNMYREVLDEFNPQEQQAIFRQLGSVPADKRDAIIGARKAERDQKLLSTVQANAPSFTAQLGYSADKPITAQEFLNNPQVRQAVSTQPGLERVFNAYVNDPKNAETVASWGIKPGKVTVSEMEQRAKGPESTGEVKDVLASIMGPDGKPLTPASAGALAPGATVTLKGGKVVPLPRGGADVFNLAKQQVFDNKLDISERQGYRAVIAKAEGEQDIPLIQVDGMKDVHLVNKTTEMPVDRIQTTIRQIREGGGESKFAAMNGKSWEAFQSTKEAEMILGQYLDISRSLTNTPGANFLQAAAFYAKTKLGVDNPGVAFDALEGTLLRMARAMQGSSQSLSNLDAKSVGGMRPSEYDSIPTALRRLEISARIIQNMKDVQLGKMQPGKLLEEIAKAKREIAGISGVDIYKDATGQSIALPRGSSHPGKGWTKQ